MALPRRLYDAVFALGWLCATTLAHAVIPSVTLKDLAGKPQPLSKFVGQGKWVVLNIWGPGCPPCVEEMPELQFFHDKFQARTAIVVGAALDYPSFGPGKAGPVKKFIAENLISFPMFLTERDITEKIGVGVLAGTPITLLFDRSGRLATFHVGPVTGRMLEDYIRANDGRRAKT